MTQFFGLLRGSPVFFPLTALLWLAPLAGQAEDYTYITNNGSITITDYTGPGGDVIMPTSISGLPVTTIGDSAFERCTSLTSVTIGSSVTTIGDYAFEICTSLASVTLPNSVTTIGAGAFYYCTSLTGVTIPNSVTTIGRSSFTSCSNLTDVTIPNSVTTIGVGAFACCTSLTDVTIPNSVTTIGPGAFGVCTSLTNVTIPNSVTTIGPSAFASCTSLTDVTIPNSVTTIGNQAFAWCTNLTGAFFNGHAPTGGTGDVFLNVSSATIYYLPGTRGWGSTFGGRPTAPWFLPRPLILTLPPDFGVQTNCFGFRVSWATNASLAIEASTDLTSSWVPLATNALADGWFYVSDSDWTNHPARFYRVRSP